jgi:transcription-repair coupling factor (superfamily II helicase)
MLDIIRSIPAYQQLVSDLQTGIQRSPLALPRAARLPILSALCEDLRKPILLLTDRSDHALTQIDELSFWSTKPNRLLFPEPNPLFYERAAWGNVTRRDRIHVLAELAGSYLPSVPKTEEKPLIISTIRAIMARTIPRRDFIKACQIIKHHQIIQPDHLLHTWAGIGYQAADLVLEQGQFSRRGGILDIWPPAEPGPIRLEFFGDEIDTLRRFDPANQRTLKNLDFVLVTPAREILPFKALERGFDQPDVDEFFLPMIHTMPASLLDYLPPKGLIVVDGLQNLQATATENEEQAVNFRRESIQEGTLAEDYPIPYLTWSEIQDSLAGHQWLDVGRSSAEDEPSELAEAFQLNARFGGKLKPLMDYLVERSEEKQRIVIVSRQVSRLKELWAERQLVSDQMLTPEFHEGSLSEGWIIRPPGGPELHLLTDSEIFGWDRPQPRSRQHPVAEAPEASYSDLKPGDWVVHVDYGIGRYKGLMRRSLEGAEREFLCVEYDSGDQLFVPVYQADRLSRYIGPDGNPPSPTRLGTADWTQAKQKVREAVLEVAQDLLELYAKRQAAQGFSFEKDTPWQHELEASFPYVETGDQLIAIKEVKKDMESPRPMDRLLCGDVGYGKTEVALRAAFKAVIQSKQVALLVPTTVLAQQHYETFKQRLAAFPVEVEMLSRFRTPKEQEAILPRIVNGSVDIIIGTHRILGQDVTFKDLGLVIIDEEQRFGVSHKEHFKKLRTEVDVLTLTATPIPRTLYMALTGVRDISTINTPPEERLPIITHIGPYSPRLVRQAILREIERGGQIFFVHNRVQTIHGMKMHLNKMVPEARIGIAHGQMNEGELASIMHQFTNGDIDVLLCTSIIESGLDIPNANTLIVDRGDTFGLAQLYQLRGRVGRGAQRAYAYFFRHRKRAPTPEGAERLEVIAENTQLGAGYSIAMRDLEMRGAGELLGTRQSGYIASVGFQLYTRLLAQAVGQIRSAQGISGVNEPSVIAREITMPVTVDLPLSIGVPIDYIADQNMRLRLYRRMADVQDEVEVQSLEEEFIDRFGPLPEPLGNLLYQMRVKIRAEKAGLTSVTAEGEQIVFRYPTLPEGSPGRNLPPISPDSHTGKNAYWLAYDDSSPSWKARLLEFLSAVIQENAIH